MALSMPPALIWQPLSLYRKSLQSVAGQFNYFQNDLKVLPPSMHFDIVNQVFELSRLQELSVALANIDTLCKLLKVFNKRVKLHQLFQAVMNWNFFTHTQRISHAIATEFALRYYIDDGWIDKDKNEIVDQGLAIGTFLSEAGWYNEAESILSVCLNLIRRDESPTQRIKALQCCQRLLNAQNGYCLFKEGKTTCIVALDIVEQLSSANQRPNMAVLYSEISTFYILQSKYQEAYDMGVQSVQEILNDDYLTPGGIIDIMRQAGKACVLKRQFKKAGLLIKQAVVIAKEAFGEQHPKFADTLIDFGFYLLNIDAIEQGIQVYQKALNLRLQIFEGVNLHVAIAHEDLSYASYVYNYSRGTFRNARNEADKAIDLLLQILPHDHLLISSSKRVKALILEEMAIDSHNKDLEAKLLKDAHELHMHALKLARTAFGEMNVQTAKHYGNLGRLLQSMKEFESAEEMHLRAISIKEQLLGTDDYEVALSVGHLASLYNYDMGFSDKAESLYLRSICIGKKLFGEAYSGLEYDYRGLLKVYATNCDMESRSKYLNILQNWKILREKVQENIPSPLNELTQPVNIELTVREFLSL